MQKSNIYSSCFPVLFAHLCNAVTCSCFRINDTPMVHFYEVHCRGTEFGLMDCNLVELTNQTCGARGFVSIHCCKFKSW